MITTIVHFSMPKTSIDEFMATWVKIKEIMLRQPGAGDGSMYRAIDEDSPFQLVNVVHWDSPEALANALKVSSGELKTQGTDLTELFSRLKIRMSQNNYIAEVSYRPTK
ncbi:MAG TPA: hypothetical protein VGU66_10615 [Candidatus Elarobacter sp.]|nr:hypothetical protein [Candidatus Elarobacter sp.]